MKKLIGLCIGLWFIPVSLFGQHGYTLSGLVKDENDQSLPGASVLLLPDQKGTVADVNGKFFIRNLPVGTYEVEISYLGYNTYKETILIDKDQDLHINLRHMLQTLQEVVVTDNYVENYKNEEPLNIEIVNEDYIKQNLGGSLMKSLERLPGVSTIDIGSGQSKPVIRGLGFNRVVVVENGIKHEGQQWGADHGLEIDQFSSDRIEVVKGPSSLIYGSDAIGGVINISQAKALPKNTVGGTIDLVGKSNNNLLGTSAYAFARKNHLYFTVRGTIMDYGDYRVPTDSIDIYSYRAPLQDQYLRNTAGKEKNIHFSLGWNNERFINKLFFSNLNSKSGFFANTHGLEPRQVDTDLHDASNRDINYPFQQVNHVKLINKSELNWENLGIESELGFQRNYRQEWSQYVDHGYMPPVFPDTLPFDTDLERQFDKYIYSANLMALYNIHNRSKIIGGINAKYQDNSIDGRGFIIPDFRQFVIGAFGLIKHTFSDRSLIQAGIRYDHGRIQIDSYYDWFPSPVTEGTDTTWIHLQRAPDMDRSFSNLSGSVGYNYNTEPFNLKINLGKSFRMPIAKELAANGVNYHRFSYEVGDPDLDPEVSYQVDAGVEWHTQKFAVGITPFVNYFANYIYLNPSSDHDRLYGNGNQVYYYTQSRVIRYGGEIHAHYDIVKCLQVGMISDYIYSRQMSGEKKGFTLPFSPPPSILFNLRYEPEIQGRLRHPYMSIDYRIVGAQNNIVPPEEKTPGYQVIDLGIGGHVKLGKRHISLSFQVQNLLNAKYFSHTSYYRLINVPEPGRNFILNLSIPFSKKLK